jgi:hypothetical protein
VTPRWIVIFSILALAHVAREADERGGGLRQPLGVDDDLRRR